VMLSAYADREHVEDARQRGASGYIVKNVDPVELPAVVQRIVSQGTFSAHGLGQDREGSAAHAAGLSERELTVLVALARGLSNREIGRELWVTEQTVKFHLRNIYRKLEISSRTEAARFVYQRLFPAAAAGSGSPEGAHAA
jgi:two-component system, NarL family, response regulator DevR